MEEQAEHLDQLYVQVKQAWFEARLASGEHAALVPELEQAVADRPLDERIWAQLMLALYRSVRQADALAAFQRLRRTLVAELGIDPGRELRDLETAILRQDPALDPPAPAAGPARALPRVPVPAQLPPAVAAFAGRGAELASLDTLLPAAARAGLGRDAAAVMVVLSGTAGVGKTALAVHWAHQVAAQFPDGQLYVNLQGFDPGGTALEPSEAVRGFLEALGVPATRIPAALPAQAGFFRSLLAGKRVLMVLDNAHDAGQVRPLLPGSPGCLAIVTSRDNLAGLVAREGAHPLTLDLLPVADARELLARRLGSGRVDSEPAAVDDIIAGCARLPLALTIAAARAATSPGFPLAVYGTELRGAARALDPLPGGDLATDVRAVFSWSYRALSDPAARMFRLLGLHPGPDISLAAAASLAAAPLSRARVLLDELTQAHLAAEHAPGRYTCHDLLRAYAAEQALADDSQDARDAAVHRVLDHYLHTARHAAMLMEPHFEPVTLSRPSPGSFPGSLPRRRRRRPGSAPSTPGCSPPCGWLARPASIPTPGGWRGRSALSSCAAEPGRTTPWRSAPGWRLPAGRTMPAGEAHAVHGLALGYARSGRFGDAYPCFHDALALFGRVGDQVSQGRIHSSLTWLAEREERLTDALDHARQAFDLLGAAGHAGQAMILNDIGYCHARLGQYQQALSYCERALAAIREVGERHWEAATWDSLGLIHHGLGNRQRAIACYQRSVDLWRELADRFNEADTLDSLGDVQRSAGDDEAASRTWARALCIFEEIGHPDRDRIRAKLRPAASAPGV